MRPNIKFIVLLVLSVLCGWIITWIDTSPGWDDTGITAGMIVLTSALFGYLKSERPWIWALTISGWIPIFSIIKSGDFRMMLVLLFGFAGAYLGSSIKNNKPAGSE